METKKQLTEYYERKISRFRKEQMGLLFFIFFGIVLTALVFYLEYKPECNYNVKNNLNVPTREETDIFCKEKGYAWGEVDTLSCYGIKCMDGRIPELLRVKCFDFDEYLKQEVERHSSQA